MTNMFRMSALGVAIMAGLGGQAIAEGKMGHGPRHSFEELDRNGDGMLTKPEMEAHMQQRFREADRDGSGTLTKAELLERMSQRQAERAEKFADRMMQKHDANGDGALSFDEMQARHKGRMWEHADSNGDGAISATEFAEMRERMKQRRGNHGMRHGHGHGQDHEDRGATE